MNTNGAFKVGDVITCKTTNNKFTVVGTLHGSNIFAGGVGLQLNPPHPDETISYVNEYGWMSKWADSINFLDKWSKQ